MDEDPIAPWRSARIAEVPAPAGAHSIHAYFNACPESPDGGRVLYYASTARDAGSGALLVAERATGALRQVAQVELVEDAHRAACQQWCDGGAAIAWHDCRAGRWTVLSAADGDGERILAEDRQLGFGSPRDHRVPLYGRHWNPGPHRDLELADVRGGAVACAVPIAGVVDAHREWILREFATEAVSVFFPVVSPDGAKVFLKIARGRGGDDFRGMDASHRQGKVVCDLASGRSLRRFDEWGHPSWAPGSDGICEVGNVLTSLADASVRAFAPGSPSNHPGISPDGRFFVTDAHLGHHGLGARGEWGIVVGSTGADGAWTIVDRFMQDGGAESWRRPHPHPVWSADGRRIYYNRNRGPWTRLQVAEI